MQIAGKFPAWHSNGELARVGLGEGWLTSSKQEHQCGEDNLSGAVAVSAVMDIHVPNLVAGQRARGVWASAR